MPGSIVFVAPFKTMARKARRVISAMKVEIPVVIGSDEQGVSKVGDYSSARILLSRGGTTKLLKQYFPDKVVVDIAASFTEISKGIEELIAKGCRNIAVVTHENIIGLSNSRLSFGSEQVEVLPCENAEEIELCVNRKIDEGADGIVGCVVAVRTAMERKIPAHFIDAEYDSIKQAVMLALTYAAVYAERENSLERQRTLIDNLEEGIIIFNAEHEPIYYNDNAYKIFAPQDKKLWHQPVLKYLDQTHRHPHVITVNQRQVVLHTAMLPGTNNETLVILQEGSFIEQSEKAMRIASYAKGLYAKISFDDLLFRDPNITELVSMARKFALSDSTVLITGETGAGKEGFAQSIHNASHRSKMPFVSVNCASLPQGLIASELFGYVEGAFTGARRQGKKGLFELAQGGTIFLDEITELPLDVQSQFLRVLQEREVMRVGDDRVIPLDIRVICAANKNLAALCEAGKFRYDLYYRINVLKLKLPPLRERVSDIIPLFTRFVAEELKRYEDDIIIDADAAVYLQQYQWPGNVRELRNAAEVCSFHGAHITLQVVRRCLGDDAGSSENRQGLIPLYISPEASAEEVIDAYLLQLSSHLNTAQMVETSGLSRTTLWRRLKQAQQRLLEKESSAQS